LSFAYVGADRSFAALAGMVGLVGLVGLVVWLLTPILG
jgi:hypothetical protein